MTREVNQRLSESANKMLKQMTEKAGSRWVKKGYEYGLYDNSPAARRKDRKSFEEIKFNFIGRSGIYAIVPGLQRATVRGSPRRASSAATRYNKAAALKTARKPSHMATDTPIIGARARAPALMELSSP
jgi:hypothetical protein